MKIRGHALQPASPNNPYQWQCSCGAHGFILAGVSAGSRARARRNEHDEHKVEVLRAQGKLEDEE